LVYEMGDPAQYITPDCIADFTTIRLAQAGKDKVRVSGVRGRPATDKLKVSIAYSYGYKAVGTLVYAWPDAYKKATAADRVLRQRLKDLGLGFGAILTEFVGADATHGRLALERAPLDELPEVQLRVGVRSSDRAAGRSVKATQNGSACSSSPTPALATRAIPLTWGSSRSSPSTIRFS